MLRDSQGHNYKERVAYLRSHERKLTRRVVRNATVRGNHRY